MMSAWKHIKKESTIQSQRCTAISIKYRLFLIALGIIGTSIILLSTNLYGVGLSYDSVGYIATARNIADGIGSVKYDGTSLVNQPPLYPAILAVIKYVLGIDPLSSARIVSACLFGLIIYMSGLLTPKYFASSTVFTIIGALSVLISKPLFEVSIMALSEPLFIFFIILQEG